LLTALIALEPGFDQPQDLVGVFQRGLQAVGRLTAQGEISGGHAALGAETIQVAPVAADLALDHRRLEIGWSWVGRAWQGTGINAEAKLLLLAHAFERLGCQRVEFKTNALNAQSRAAMEKMGARFEGIFRKHGVMADGTVRDTAWYSIIDDEWPAVKAGLEARLRTATP